MCRAVQDASVYCTAKCLEYETTVAVHQLSRAMRAERNAERLRRGGNDPAPICCPNNDPARCQDMHRARIEHHVSPPRRYLHA
jgi:hypothetical protein